MRYTIEFHDRVSNSAFIYYITKDQRLKGCDIVITSNHDKWLYDLDNARNLSFKSLKFEVNKNYFNSKGTHTDIENILKRVEEERKGKGWNCIRLDNPYEFESAIQNHYQDYVESVDNRIKFQKAKKIN